MKLRLATSLVTVTAFLLLGAGTAAAQDKPEPILNAEAHLAGDEAYGKADLVGKLDIITALTKEKRLDSNQKRWAQVRLLIAEAKAKGVWGDLPKLAGWLGAFKKDYKNPVTKALGSGSGLDDLIELYGTRRLYADEAFQKGDIPAKLKMIADLWKARELNQSITYSLTNELVYRHLSAAGDDIDKALTMFGELYRADVMVWDSTGAIHRALLWRGLHEKKELDTTEKKLAWIGTVTERKTGDLAWMMVGRVRAQLVVDMVNDDEAFTKLDAAGREAKIDEWVKAKLIGSTDKTALIAAYGAKKK